MMTSDDGPALQTLEDRLVTLLPEDYQGSYEDLQPVSMGSAALKYDSDGKVTWDEIWGSFCDLALAGGPPHRGTLLQPASAPEIHAQPDRHGEVAAEICRGVNMVTDLEARLSSIPGWVRVFCLSEVMAAWLLRAIVTENVAVRCEGMTVDLPAGPDYRLEKEIKNVVTVIGKTCHYWMGHVPRAQKQAIGSLFATMAEEAPLVAPARAKEGLSESHPERSAGMAEAIQRVTGLSPSHHRYAGWLGLHCPSVRAAIWMMRMLVASNVLSRREGTVLFVPVNPLTDSNGDAVVRSVTRIHCLARTRAVL